LTATPILQSRYQLSQVRQEAPPAIKSPCHEGVALFQRCERLIKPRTPTPNLPVTLNFANGIKKKLFTGRRDFAFAPRGATTKAVSVTVHTETPIAGDMTITFAPLQHGVVRIGFDRQQLTARPFDTLRLRIAGPALVIEGVKGRYDGTSSSRRAR
jgi:hypothetical protein